MEAALEAFAEKLECVQSVVAARNELEVRFEEEVELGGGFGDKASGGGATGTGVKPSDH